ncbi:signal transduction histidine kinase/ligand-binding sensor domain-containing protein [Povalibacter uvarum]|uniref:Signal transduction histidine kinase/ligand-binding sensor domain-containing protein n=1 Tax=Povalibacter uvarum TaxID=732238 RepID=A0A841HNY9_9GAMM|nr:two-component regulator propeller domain-containing protein [Povalibacter uvarum]MBB6093980.1 signal transduction histidine kinase/ligand-binding sensor domain-containing protein [Povalibacter uvarum]
MATRSTAFRLLQSAIAIAAALLATSHASALPPDLHIAQLHHTAWTAKDGAPGGIESLAQTADGYLWIAGAAGLFRFDGVRFERIDSIRGQRLPSTNVLSLFAPRDGGLWVGYRFGGASFIRDGKVTNYGEREGLPAGSLTRFAQDSSGLVWADTSFGLRRFDGSLWEDIRERFDLPSEYVKATKVARDGTLWIVVGRTVLFLRSGESAFAPTTIRTSEEMVDFVEAPDGTLWLTDASLGMRPVYIPGDGVAVTSPLQHGWIALRNPQQVSLWGKLIDRDGTLWTASAAGIHRIRDVGQLLGRTPMASARSDDFSSDDGLTGPYANAFLEDREGNIWIGTASGIDRFRESRLTRVPLPHGANGFAIAPGDAGTMLVGIDFDEGAFKVSGSSTVDTVPGPQFITSAYRTDDGVVWFGGRAMLWHSNGSQWTPVTMPVDRDNANYYPVQAITRDRSGAMWVSVVRGGVLRLADGNWTRESETALSLAAAPDGRVWLGFPGSRIQVIDPASNSTRDLSIADGLDIGNVMSILPHEKDVWVGGELGLARFDGQHFHTVSQRDGTQLPSVSGIVTTTEGDLWLSTSAGAIRIPADDVQRVSADSKHAVRAELFDHLDGLPGTPNAIRPLPSIAAGTDGRLWFATTSGIAWIDPRHVATNSLAPNVEVQSIVVDGNRYEPGASLRLPINPRDVQISYTALSLSIPERVRFRYRLGADKSWQDAGSRRTAFFTDLAPGDYEFRVIASNNDGIWNEAGASVAFTIPPAFRQTTWFYALCALAAAALLTVFYRVRVRQLAAQVRGRLEARLAERERIARDLHDTLLQGVQGLIWRFQAATDRIPANEPARQLMEQSLERADKLLGESRDKVKDLRPAASSVADFAQALAAEGEQFAQLHSAKFRVGVEGTQRDLHPIVREEGLMIAREALANAFRHASATDIEAEVTYGNGALHIRIRDDGRGIGEAILAAGGRPGHFGLLGMRERAKKLGAHLEVWSKPGAGTEIDLRVPANVAYRKSQPARRSLRSWLGATT